MIDRLAQWDRGAGFAPIRAAWLRHAAGVGGEIVVRLPRRELSGTFDSLDPTGRLMLRLPDEDAKAREYERFVDDLKIVAVQMKKAARAA